jgi:hypothetical protein
VRAAESGELVFEELGTPTRAEVLDVARRAAERVNRLLQRSLEREGDEPVPELVFDEPGLASCYAAATQGISVSGEPAGCTGKAQAPARRLARAHAQRPGSERSWALFFRAPCQLSPLGMRRSAHDQRLTALLVRRLEGRVRALLLDLARERSRGP